MASTLANEQLFRQVADTVLAESTADDTFVSFGDSESSTLRFANNQVVQNVSVRSPRVSVRVAFGRKVGSASTNRFDRASLREVVKTAERIAQVAPDDPEYMSPLGPAKFPRVPSYHAPTANTGPMDVANRTKPVIDKCERHELTGAGIMTNASAVRGIAASTGLMGFERTTEACFSLTATAADSSGWTLNAHRDINALDVRERANCAIEKALLSRNPRRIDAGHYPVILEPAAVAGIFGPVFWNLGAKSYYKGNSAMAGKLGSVVVDARLSVQGDPTHRDLLGRAFSREGLPSRKTDWIKDGVLKQLYFDRFTAKERGVTPTPFPSAPIMTFRGPTVGSIEELIAQTERAILVTNFWYIRSVDARDLTVTGMTRDGTFLVEDGKIVGGVRNFRFHDSPLRCFQLVNAATKPLEAITLERGKMLLPAIKLPDFNFSSVTKF